MAQHIEFPKNALVQPVGQKCTGRIGKVGQTWKNGCIQVIMDEYGAMRTFIRTS